MNDSDRFLDETLHSLGRNRPLPDGLSPKVRANCMTAFSPQAARSRSILRRPALLSTVGMVVIVAAVAGLIFPTNGGPAVQAAVVLEKLSNQVADPNLLEVQLDQVQIEEVSVHGIIYLGADGIAGDLQATINEGEGPIEVDVSLGISEQSGWILVRNLRIPDKQAQMIIDLFLPRGSETLVMLPSDLLGKDLALGLGNLDDLRQLATGQVAEIVKVIVESKSTAGATTTKLADGTILLNLEIRDAQTVRSPMGTLAKAMGEDPGDQIDIDEGDIADLLGAKVAIVYDPASESVRSFSVSGIGGIKGAITVSLLTGPIDPALLDSARVAKPGTRLLDVGSLMQSFEGLQGLINSQK